MFDSKKLIITFFFVTIAISIANSRVCGPNDCKQIECSEDINCAPGERKEKGGYCLCCDECKKVVGEGEDCVAIYPDTNPIPTNVTCDFRYICYNGKCRNALELSYEQQKLKHKFDTPNYPTPYVTD